MFTPNPDEIVIYGTTSNGKTFRPSDWAERLCGILSSFDKGNRLSYHQWVRPLLIGKIRSVAVGKQLETINPPMFRFLMDFAADNDLRVLDEAMLRELANEQSQPAEAPPPQPEPSAAPQKPEGQPFKLREIPPEETTAAFAALSILRPTLNDVARFAAQVNNEQRAAGYRLLGIFEEGKNNAVAVCGFRITTTLAFGRHIVIDDLVTVPQTRGRGYCTHLLQAVVDIAESKNIAQIHTHVSVGSERADAHRMYLKHGFEINAHHFVCKTERFRR